MCRKACGFESRLPHVKIAIRGRCTGNALFLPPGADMIPTEARYPYKLEQKEVVFQ
jgi:hypothetical protein